MIKCHVIFSVVTAILIAALSSCGNSLLTSDDAVHSDASAHAIVASAPLRTITCANTTEFQLALVNAKPGDRIVLKPGVYLGIKKQIPGTKFYPFFWASVNGTAANNIIIESESSTNRAILTGNGAKENGYGLSITGDYYQVRNLVVRSAAKGIVLDNSNYTTLSNVEVYDVGDEAVHFRDGSSNCSIKDSYIHDTGKDNPGWGEGIYVGSDNGAWSDFSEAVYDTVISNCMLGPNVSAEHVDIKEGTRRTIVEYCTFDGAGISGDNSSESFIDCKGIDAHIRFNKGDRKGNSNINAAFHTNNRKTKDSGTGSWFYGNDLKLDSASVYMVRTAEGTCTFKVWNNTATPVLTLPYAVFSGSTYTVEDPGYNGPVTSPSPTPPQPSASELPPSPTPPNPSPSSTPIPIRDDFEYGTLNGGNGNWVGAWKILTGDSGTFQTDNEYAIGNHALNLRNGTSGERVIDMTSRVGRTTGNILEFDYLIEKGNYDSGEGFDLYIYDGTEHKIVTWTDTNNTNNVWKRFSLNLNQFKLTSDFKFKFVNRANSNSEEIYIDNINISL